MAKLGLQGGKRVDQLAKCIHSLKNDKYSRNHVISAWNVCDLDKMALPPCHPMLQFYCVGDALSCLVYQRSADIFIGLPHDIAVYALLLKAMALEVDMRAENLVFAFGDAHIYWNHFSQVEELINRVPFPSAKVKIELASGLLNISPENIKITNYHSHPAISAPVNG